MTMTGQCPICGGRLQAGYGLLGGGAGAYWSCIRRRCGWFHKERECLVCESVLGADDTCPDDKCQYNEKHRRQQR